ncbi:UNVERIFIED_CONTAM: hypothetical protein RMT77_004591 [Armadillidium vulgare]
MNSYVSVEEEDVQCDDLDSLVLNASSIFGTGLLSKCVDSGDLVINKEELDEPSVETGTDFVCVTGSDLGTNIVETRSKAKQKHLKRSKETNIFQYPKVHPEFEVDGKLISLDVGESYENLSSLDIECLPFETVLMNYPGQVDYFDLNDKLLNISGSPNLFDSDQDSESFDGFTEDSNSSFEGFNDCKPSSETSLNYKSTKKTKRVKSSKLAHSSEEQKSGINLDLNCKPETLSESVHKGVISPVFGDHRVTSLVSRTEDFTCQTKSDSTFSRSSPLSRPISIGDNKLPKNNQNYSKSITSSFCNSTVTKFKEKTNESGTMQQKSKKERLKSQSPNNIHKRKDTSTDTSGEPILNYEDIFSDESDLDVTFEGFQENFESLSLEVKKEVDESNDIEEFIGLNCNKIGCTVSWLESKQAKNPPQLVNNGIVFELSEFAKKIAWESDYVAEWICRLMGYLDIMVSNEDMRKINIVLKRRKALSVNFAGKCLTLKSKLATFDAESFTLPSIENVEAKKIINNPMPVLKNNINEPFNEKTCDKASKNKDINKAKSNLNEKVPNDNVLSNSENEKELQLSENDIQKEAINYKDLDKEECTEREDHSDIDSLFEISELEISDKDISDCESNLSENSNIKVSLESRISGRVRKPTAKAQESYSIKYFGSSTPPQNISPIRSMQNSSPMKPKILHPIFHDNGKDIGPHCKMAHIDIKLLNSSMEASFPITKGVVYELYHFFRERKASLTSLVHTLYRLKNIPFDKSQIIATMAKIHEMVKVMWKENIDKDNNMPYEEVNLLNFENFEGIKAQPSIKTTAVKQKAAEITPEPLSKKRKYSLSIESLSGKEYDSNSESSESLKENSNKSFDLNSTKGFEGKITRGDIVYLYTKWLKKKMEGHSNVFVTDLSKDVEELIIERKVECIRIPVGTLMSSSVKLFEEFRKLSKVNMLDAKTYLLEDWIDDIKCILNSTGKKTEGNQDLNINRISNANFKNKLSKSECLPKENISTSKEENITEPELLLSTKKSVISCVSDDYEVEKIVGYRIVKMGEQSITEYRIRWLGFSSKDDSWINEADLNCPEILTKFWDALNKQRALKNKTDSLTTENSISHSVNDDLIKSQKISFDPSPPMIGEPANLPPLCSGSSIIPVVQNNTVPEVNQSINSVTIGQENISPFFGKQNKSSQSFFNIMINGLKPDLVDYQHEEESSFLKRVKITKGEVLILYDDWRLQNQKHELTGGNKKIDVNILISKVKDLVASKKVRNFNPSSIIDACYRMSLMRAKLKDSNKIQEYLSGDFMELMQMSQKHQEFVRSENAEKLKKIKQSKSNGLNENEKLNSKINNINNLERESLIIARYLDSNKNKNIEKDLESNILVLKKKLSKEQIEEKVIENIRKENPSVIKELEAYGVVENTLNEILNIATKIKI